MRNLMDWSIKVHVVSCEQFALCVSPNEDDVVIYKFSSYTLQTDTLQGANLGLGSYSCCHKLVRSAYYTTT